MSGLSEARLERVSNRTRPAGCPLVRGPAWGLLVWGLLVRCGMLVSAGVCSSGVGGRCGILLVRGSSPVRHTCLGPASPGFCLAFC